MNLKLRIHELLLPVLVVCCLFPGQNTRGQNYEQLKELQRTFEQIQQTAAQLQELQRARSEAARSEAERRNAAANSQSGASANSIANMSPSARQQALQQYADYLASLKKMRGNHEAYGWTSANLEAQIRMAEDAISQLKSAPSKSSPVNSYSPPNSPARSVSKPAPPPSPKPAARIMPPYDWNQFNDGPKQPMDPNAKPSVVIPGSTEANPNPIRWRNTTKANLDELPISRRRNFEDRNGSSSKGSAWDNFGKEQAPSTLTENSKPQPTASSWKGKSEAELKAHLKLLTEEFEAGYQSEADYIKVRKEILEASKALPQQ